MRGAIVQPYVEKQSEMKGNSYSWKHGESTSTHLTKEYTTWCSMKQRCYNPKNVAYENYGGRDIRVCKCWLGKNGYLNFLEDMGRAPSKEHSLDRIDNDGNYTPENCRWLIVADNIKNRPGRVRLDAFRHTISALCIMFALSCNTQTPIPPSTPVVVVDSTCCRARDSLHTLLREQRILISLAKQQMVRYAKIVQRDPSQARFIVGWTRRSFEMTLPDTTH